MHNQKPSAFPPQSQPNQPGIEANEPQPVYTTQITSLPTSRAVIITGGDMEEVTPMYAKEGQVAIVYLKRSKTQTKLW